MHRHVEEITITALQAVHVVSSGATCYGTRSLQVVSQLNVKLKLNRKLMRKCKVNLKFVVGCLRETAFKHCCGNPEKWGR